MNTSVPSSLAAERTALAWRRTALGLVAGSVAAGRLLVTTWGAVAWSVTVAGTLLAVVLLRAAHRRRSGVHGRPPATLGPAAAATVGRDPGGRLVATCAIALVLLGAAALAVVLTWPG